MKIYLDTSKTEEIKVGIGDNPVVIEKRAHKSQRLLTLIDEQICTHGKVSDVSEIELNPGPGSFTGLRVGASVANAMGWILRIPVNGKRTPIEPDY